MDRYKVCVLGGSGFIGAEICRLAVAMGHEVISVSRGGRPALDEPWLEGVTWVGAHVLDTDEWAGHLQDCEALVHSVGIVDEVPHERQTFAHLHRDSVQLAAEAAQSAEVPKFVFLSAAKAPPSLPHAYLQTKLDAEATLQASSLSFAILRPIRVCGSNGALSPGGAGVMAAAAAEHTPLRQWAEQTRGLRREKVAMAALRAALQPETSGVLEVAEIDHLGDAMFIQ
jgi:NADH dehydrogenase